MVKLNEMTVEQRKAYNDEKTEYRKTNEFFKDTAVKRTNNVITSLRILGFMGKYNHTDDQVYEIFTAVDNAVNSMKSQFQRKEDKETPFSL